MEEEKLKKNTSVPSLQEVISDSGVLKDSGKAFTANNATDEKSSFKKYESSLKPLRTYQGDVDEAISHTGASLVSIAVAEQKKKILTMPDAPAEKEEVAEDSAVKNKFFAIGGLFLFVLGVAILGYVYYANSQNNVVNVTKTNSIIGYSEILNIPIASSTRPELIDQIVKNEKSYNKPVNSILYINATENNNPANINDLLGLLAPKMPPELERSLSNEYMFGVYSFDINGPFLILKTEDYGGSFAGMLKWEESMVSDIGQIFNVPDRMGTTTPYTFLDESIHNQDLRVIKNENGKVILLYSFIDKNTIIITNTENIFNAIAGKYFSSKIVR